MPYNIVSCQTFHPTIFGNKCQLFIALRKLKLLMSGVFLDFSEERGYLYKTLRFVSEQVYCTLKED